MSYYTRRNWHTLEVRGPQYGHLIGPGHKREADSQYEFNVIGAASKREGGDFESPA